MGRMVNNKGMVLMSKDGVTHEFVLESVPVWKAKGWSVEDADQDEASTNEVSVLLAEQAKLRSEEEDPNAKVREALSTEAKAVTGPKTAKK